MGLTDQLNAAVDAPPPPGYDLDQLLRRARRGRTRRRAATGLAGLAALALVAGAYVAASQVRPAEHGRQAEAPASTQAPATTGTASPPGTASPADTIPRLNATLRQLPTAFGAPGGVRFAFHGPDPSYQYGYYNASWTHAGMHFIVLVNFTRDPLPAADSCGQPPTASCTPVIRPDVHAFLIEDPTQRFTIAVGSRLDGTVVEISAQREGRGTLLDPYVLFQATLLPGFAVQP